MAGNNLNKTIARIRHRGMVLSDRDRNLLRELAVMRLIDREMAKQVGKFGSTTRANVRLLKLKRAGFLNRFFVGTISGGRKAVYALSPKGAALSGIDHRPISRSYGNTVVGDLFVAHQERINEFYIALKHSLLPKDVRLVGWQTFPQPISATCHLRPDAYCVLDTASGSRAHFLEVDLGTESMRVWAAKAASYISLARSGEFSTRFAQPQFRVLVVTTTPRRLAHIRAAIAKQTNKIFWLADFSIIHREGIWSPVWLRPTGGETLQLV